MKGALAIFLLSPAVWGAQPSIQCSGCLAIAGADGALYTTSYVDTSQPAPARSEGGSGGIYVARYRLYAAVAPYWRSSWWKR